VLPSFVFEPRETFKMSSVRFWTSNYA